MRSDLYGARAISHRFVMLSGPVPTILVAFRVVGKHDQFGIVSWVGLLEESRASTTLASLRRAGWDGCDFRKMTGLGSREVDVLIVARPVEAGGDVPRVVAIYGKGTASIARHRPASGAELAELEERLRVEHHDLFTHSAAKEAGKVK